MRRYFATLVLSAFATFAPSAHADPIRFVAELAGIYENPPNASPATGAASFELDTAAHTLLIDLVFSGLTGTTTNAHIHCCAALPSLNAGVATTVPSFAGFPSGVTAGTFQTLLDLTLASSWNPAFVTNNGGTLATAEAALTAGMQAGQAYINVHTTAFTGGEIRGNLVVPEPGTLALLALVLLPLGGARIRARARA